MNFQPEWKRAALNKRMQLANLVENEVNKNSYRKPKTLEAILLDEYNQMYADKYKIKPTTNRAKDTQLIRNLLKVVLGDQDRARKIMQTFVRSYETLPFVNLALFPRPMLGGMVAFAQKVEEYISGTSLPEDDAQTLDYKRLEGFHFD